MKKFILLIASMILAVGCMIIPAGAFNDASEITAEDLPLPRSYSASAMRAGDTIVTDTSDPANVNIALPPHPENVLDMVSTAAVQSSDCTVIKGSAVPQYNHGAHYYAFAPYNNSYQEAFANIKLPTSLNTKSIRTAYISLGIHGSVHGIDLGLKNDGSGWYPVSYDVNGAFTEYTGYRAPSTATNAIMVVKPLDATHVGMYLQFVNSSGASVGTTFDKSIQVNSGNLTYSGSYIQCKFYRFASLVPNSGTTDNRADGTYMRGGQFTNLGLYLRSSSSYQTWGINTARVANAWKVYPSKLSLSYTANNDTFSINHS